MRHRRVRWFNGQLHIGPSIMAVWEVVPMQQNHPISLHCRTSIFLVQWITRWVNDVCCFLFIIYNNGIYINSSESLSCLSSIGFSIIKSVTYFPDQNVMAVTVVCNKYHSHHYNARTGKAYQYYTIVNDLQ